MNQLPPVRIFIGSGEASAVERNVLIHSLRKHCSREIDLFVINGTHDAIEHNDEPPVLASMPLDIKYRNFTEFSLYRFLIPEICGHQGRAIFLDSDIVSLGDISELFDLPMNGHDILAVPEYGEGMWASSVMLMNCETCRFDLPSLMQEIDRGDFQMSDLTQFSPNFLKYHPFKPGPLPGKWNSFDRRDDETKVIHYTNLMTQPWKYSGHPFGALWFEYFDEAQQLGILTEDTLQKSVMRSYVRPDIRSGNQTTAEKSTSSQKTVVGKIKREVSRVFRSKKAA